MDNNRLKLLKQYIGKPFSGSPSPFAKWLDGIVISASEKSVEFQFTVRKEMTNPVGMLHGGVISGMIDECIGVTFFVMGLEYFYPTINLNVEFFSAAQEGDTVRVQTQVVKQGKTIINIKADMLNESGKILASATSNLAVSGIKIPF
ncbi:PaaI family thioesterase [Fulvivirga ulvae]|uniref:PaaI family thioesterase n=1 Tax=Fulvivirga ulvae TaxID=2904245 RepID=UPI001F1F4048|nr:PaaI family thioesterase [Fulvivirga ulvae]UII31158.1 PaaI family thioesterase [Fulvivirga ulvae]